MVKSIASKSSRFLAAGAPVNAEDIVWSWLIAIAACGLALGILGGGQ